ncbi:MAG: hypothetical protein WCP21_19905 [Armatimonadota bacterium]
MLGSWIQMIVIGFLQPFLYQEVQQVEAQMQAKYPQFFPASGGIAIPDGEIQKFIQCVLKSLLAVIQKK